MNTREFVQKHLENALEGSSIEVLDPRGDDCHLEAIVVSEKFEGLSLIKQHQLVMNTLKDHFNGGGLHALALKTYTPQAWKEKNNV
ncbi:MAG: BolA/IbaG family iron-sulfur metabolism protein [Chlamydiia bacterium]|nr:BolA/IbaG family iron-sulfur metabolism protein [Chlamydiia bacterium]